MIRYIPRIIIAVTIIILFVVVVLRSDSQFRKHTISNIAPIVPLKILFIGDNLTAENRMYELVGYFLGPKSIVHADVADSSGLDTHISAGDIEPYLKANTYDYIVLQGQSMVPLIDNGNILIRNVRMVDTLVHSLAPTAKVVLFQTWSHCVNDPWYAQNSGQTPQTAQESIDEAYFEAAQIHPVVPVGDAFLTFRLTDAFTKTDPILLNCSDSDFLHPTPYGSLLAAYTFYCFFTGLSPITAPPLSEMTGDLADIYRGLNPDIVNKLMRIEPAHLRMFPLNT